MLNLLIVAALAAPQDPRAATQVERQLSELGLTIREQRLVDSSTGAVRARAVDGSGAEVDAVALRRLEIERRDARHGKLHPTLAATLAAGGEHEVAFWLRRPAGMPDLRLVLDQAIAAGASPADARRLAMATARQFVLPANGAFAATARAAAATVTYVDEITPVVFVRADAAVLRALALDEVVDLAYATSGEWFPEHDPGLFVEPGAVSPAMFNHWASKTARTDVVHRRGINGAGVKVLVNDVGAVVTTNPLLPPIVAGTSGTPQSHATAVAGIIASRHTLHTGAAPGLTELYSYGGAGDVTAPQAWAWGMNQGISFGNCSWWNGQKGQIQFLDRYFDYIIRQFAVMLFKSAGNQGGSDGKVTTPGCGYNMIASGNADDRNNHDWNDDVMSPSSSWVNPIEGHEKPEVTACGTTITTTTNSSPWTGAQGTGTSFASPVTCGAAALLAQQDPALQARPEAVRALLMAGAFHNIEGAARLSDRDGVGHINAAASHSALVRGQLHTATLTPASFVNGAYEVTVPLVAFDETRICAVWFSLADSSYSTDVLQMDLDMVVSFGGTPVAVSASAANPFEIVQFVPSFTGNYTVRLVNQQFLGTTEPFALAWVTRRDCATNEVVLGGNPAPGGTVTFEFIDSYHPGASYLAVLSVTPPPGTIRVGPIKVLEIGYDAVTEWSLTLPGFVGLLDGNGRATAALTLPNLPWLSGLPVYSAVVSLDMSLPELVEETSPAAAFVIQ